jgi:hypothetical protein
MKLLVLNKISSYFIMNIKESLENSIFQIPIAHLSNNEKIINDTNLFELNDTEISLDLFKNCFYNNNYEYFELNTQYNDFDEFMIQNKTIKSQNMNIFNNQRPKIILMDIINNNFICNKKKKINDIIKVSFIKDINKYNSLFDFKIYNNHLNFNDIITIYNQDNNKINKKYFRFKIIATYYSVDLDESVSICFNYLVEIPKNMTISSTNDQPAIQPTFQPVIQPVIQQAIQPVIQPAIQQAIQPEIQPEIQQVIDDSNANNNNNDFNFNKTSENMVYSNYIKNRLDNEINFVNTNKTVFNCSNKTSENMVYSNYINNNKFNRENKDNTKDIIVIKENIKNSKDIVKNISKENTKNNSKENIKNTTNQKNIILKTDTITDTSEEEEEEELNDYDDYSCGSHNSSISSNNSSSDNSNEANCSIFD